MNNYIKPAEKISLPILPPPHLNPDGNLSNTEAACN